MAALRKLWFHFSGRVEGFFINDDADHVRVGNRHMETAGMDRIFLPSNYTPRTIFNDLPFYKELLKENGCIDVKISSINLRHSHFTFQFQAVYRLTFEDGRSEIRNGPENFDLRDLPLIEDKYYEESFHLNENEHLTGIHVNIMDDNLGAIRFVTNQRYKHFGDYAFIPMMTPATPLSSMRIIAFCGNMGGDGLRRIGFYAQEFRWNYHGTYVLMRQLVKDGRAHIQQQVEDRGNKEGDVLLPSIMQGLIHLDEGIFRNVMKFLA